MISPVESRSSRLFGSLCLVIIAAGILAAVLFPIASRYFAAEQEIARLSERREQLAERRKDVTALQTLRDSIAAADPAEFGIIAAETVEVARAEIQQALQGFADEAGAAISSVSSSGGEDGDAASLSANLTLPADRLAELLAMFANAEPAIFINAISIDSRRRRSDQVGETILELRVELVSYVTVGEVQ